MSLLNQRFILTSFRRLLFCLDNMIRIHILTGWKEDTCALIFIGQMKNDKREIWNIDLLFTNDVTFLLRQKDRTYRFPFARNVSETLILYLLSMGAICQIICVYIYRVHSLWNLQPHSSCATIVHGTKILAGVRLHRQHTHFAEWRFHAVNGSPSEMSRR